MCPRVRRTMVENGLIDTFRRASASGFFSMNCDRTFFPCEFFRAYRYQTHSFQGCFEKNFAASSLKPNIGNPASSDASSSLGSFMGGWSAATPIFYSGMTASSGEGLNPSHGSTSSASRSRWYIRSPLRWDPNLAVNEVTAASGATFLR
jgi:hypothetical protein